MAATVASLPLLALGCAALLLRLTVRDAWPLFAFVYYATPYFVIAGLTLLAALASLRLRKWGRALLAAALTLLCGVRGYQTAFFWNAPGSAEQPLRLALWNAGRGVRGAWPDIAEQVSALDADVIALVEAGRGPRQDAFWRARLPGYEHAPLHFGLRLAVRGRVEVLDTFYKRQRAWWQVSRVTVAGRSFVVALVDVHSDPFYPKREAFEGLRAALAPYADEPLLVLGDFNTPSDSVYFDPLRATMREAFETAGRGYAPTWPAGAPLLTLDQVWTGGIRVAECRRQRSRHSDHLIVLATLDLAPAGTATGSR